MGYLSLSDYDVVRIDTPFGHMMGHWYGNRKDRPILAIHGWQDNIGTFDTLIPLLPDYLGVLCMDMPGHGYSSNLPAGMHYSADDWILIISRVMKEYKWSKVSLMGHSLGGVLSYIHTALAPQTVDMVILLDITLPPFDAPECIPKIGSWMEKHLVEEDRNRLAEVQEPPSYTMEQLRVVLSRGTFNSVPLEFAQHLLNRSVRKSSLYPNRYYFSRDGRTKYHTLLPFCAEKALELIKRVKDKPYLIIKGSGSPFIDSRCDEVLNYLSENNPYFEFYEVEGLHHVHLTNAAECAKHIVPFLRRYRPPPMGSWSMAEEETKVAKGKL
ncbi:probable serine hydrolase [Drosophila nasuta]|uniref:probable serine hydrolase n=1 Tax=Drosophila nasuta TaxID=42062 RepID=UPI00295EE97A|nr:probable serine hydrolase [Drosophila nasuta]